MEFVVIDPSGKETDWIDPVVELRETKCYWVVHNGHYEYRFFKKKGYKYLHRKLEDE